MKSPLPGQRSAKVQLQLSPGLHIAEFDCVVGGLASQQNAQFVQYDETGACSAVRTVSIERALQQGGHPCVVRINSGTIRTAHGIAVRGL